MRDIVHPLSSLKLHKEVTELMAADGKRRSSKLEIQTLRWTSFFYIPHHDGSVQDESRADSETISASAADI